MRLEASWGPAIDEPEDKALSAARHYVRILEENPAYQAALVKEVVNRGDRLLEEAGSLAGAGMALQAVWWEKHGHHLKGIFDARLEGLVDGQLLKYARAVAT